MRTTEDLVRRALVRTIRANSTLVAALPGGQHEDIAPRNVAQDFLTYALVDAAYDDDWTGRTIRSLWDVIVTSEDQVRASTTDSLVMAVLEDSLLPITVEPQGGGDPVVKQVALYCRRVAGIRDKEITDDDRTVYRVGGTYSIWSFQPLHENVAVTASEVTATSDTV